MPSSTTPTTMLWLPVTPGQQGVVRAGVRPEDVVRLRRADLRAPLEGGDRGVDRDDRRQRDLLGRAGQGRQRLSPGRVDEAAGRRAVRLAGPGPVGDEDD